MSNEHGERPPKTGAGYKVLAVDDSDELLATLVDFLVLHDFEVFTATNGKEALAVAQEKIPDLIILDVTMPEMDGLEATRVLKKDPDLRYIPVVLLTARGSIEHVVEGLACGADDYLTKPFEERELVARLQAALRTKEIYSELSESQKSVARLQETLEGRFSFANIIGSSEPMQRLYTLIEKLADSDIPVLISGESGTGKELVAKALHFNSPRAGKPFVVQNCAAFQESLLEAELFGYVKGAFTGATRDKRGLFETAHLGTLFLDEVGEMSPSLQAKLLRVLQDGTFTAVGDTKPRQSNVRLLCASHKDLRKLVEEGQFREDLLYRINVVELKLPPLRERAADIPLLVDHFLELHADTGKAPGVEKELLDVLMSYTWPGNIRQLQNEIRRLLVLADSDQLVLTCEGLSPQILEALSGVELRSDAIGASRGIPSSISTGTTLKQEIEKLERKLIGDTLKDTDGNRSETARRLGVSRSSLIAKIQSYELD